MPDTDTVPLVGRIACGEPITAEENLEGSFRHIKNRIATAF